MLELKNITVGYGNKRVVCGLNASLPDSSLTAVVGLNGAGKSTLLRAISGLEKPMAGLVSIDAQPVHSLAPEIRARKIAFVASSGARPQGMSVRQLIALGRAPYTNTFGSLLNTDNEAVERAITSMSLESLATRQCASLSDGELQRARIAAALAQETQVIILDEPTSFLDMPSRHALARMLAQTARQSGKTTIFSTHELDIALCYAQHILLIDSCNQRASLIPAASTECIGEMRRIFDPEARQTEFWTSLRHVVAADGSHL